MKQTLSNGVTLAYEKTGTGPNLILMHGNGQDHHDFDAMIPELSKHFTCYAVDSRGQGESSNHGEIIHYEDMADDFDLFIQELNLEEVNIMGHSDGAIIALLLGIAQKEYLRRLILLSVTIDTVHITEETKAILTQMVEESDHDPMVELMLHEPDIPLDELSKVTVPTLIGCADHDVMNVSEYETLASVIPQAELYVVPGTNHLTYVLGTDRIVPEVIHFLAKSEWLESYPF